MTIGGNTLTVPNPGCRPQSMVSLHFYGMPHEAALPRVHCHCRSEKSVLQRLHTLAQAWGVVARPCWRKTRRFFGDDGAIVRPSARSPRSSPVAAGIPGQSDAPRLPVAHRIGCSLLE